MALDWDGITLANWIRDAGYDVGFRISVRYSATTILIALVLLLYHLRGQVERACGVCRVQAPCRFMRLA